jgi:membrane-associated phospholipid phosphatase
LPWNANATAPGGYNADAICPYGHRIKFVDVTVPNNATLLEHIWVIYGILPFAVMGLGVIDSVLGVAYWHGFGTRSLVFLVFVGLQVALGELIFKRLVQQMRPPESCNYTCGMPSSHSTMSIGFYTLMFLDASYRLMPTLPLDENTARIYSRLSGKSTNKFRRCRDSLLVLFNLLPITSSHTLGTYDFILFTTIWSVLLLPVAPSRVALNDHTAEQVVVGGIIGVVEAVLYWVLVQHFLLENFNHRLGEHFLCFTHNYAMPLYEAFSKAFYLLAEADDVKEAPGYALREGLVQDLLDMYGSLGWYLSQVTEPCCGKDLFDRNHPEVEHEYQVLTDVRQEILKRLDDLSPEDADHLRSSSDGEFSKLKAAGGEEGDDAASDLTYRS